MKLAPKATEGGHAAALSMLGFGERQTSFRRCAPPPSRGRLYLILLIEEDQAGGFPSPIKAVMPCSELYL
jgi:hypothetical protein